ncbi:hypothetical protein ACW6B4_003199 [Yersinia ruckeri]|uniref:hypothetical protein n=1 Tax=Yersinia ruckeri TaxID=29486 RepID=UPI000536D81B|nr:hypothetical protein [Yersinia ruckeri]AUQ43883.1 hypothetical protein NJ56_18090 [Yersinia ruckeri]WMS07365.1 hypothetical protein RDY86_17550 [Yersinia ruckeri]
MYQTTNDTTDRFSWDAGVETAYWQSREVSAKTEPEAITLTEFMDAIGNMYPLDWQGDAHSQSFKLPEMYCGNVTYIYAKVGECYFKFRDVLTLSHTAIVKRLEKEIQSLESKNQK